MDQIKQLLGGFEPGVFGSRYTASANFRSFKSSIKVEAGFFKLFLMHLKFLKGYAHFDNSSWEELRSKGFSLMTFVLPCTIFLYDTRYLLHLLVLELPYANRLLNDSGFYAAKPFRHCYLVHNWKIRIKIEFSRQFLTK